MNRRVAGALALLLAGAQPAAAQFGPQGPPAVGVMTAERRPITLGRMSGTHTVIEDGVTEGDVLVVPR